MTPKAFAQSYAQEKIALLGNLNKERNQLMTEIDKLVGTELIVRDKL